MCCPSPIFNQINSFAHSLALKQRLGATGNGLFQVACEQVLQGTLVAGEEKEGELATTSLECEFHPRVAPRVG